MPSSRRSTQCPLHPQERTWKFVRRRQPTSLRLLARHRASWSRYFRPCWKMRCIFAALNSACSGCAKAIPFAVARRTAHPKPLLPIFVKSRVFHPRPETGLGQVLRTKQPFQLADLAAEPTYEDALRKAAIKLAGTRSMIGVPMVKDDAVIASVAAKFRTRPAKKGKYCLLCRLAVSSR